MNYLAILMALSRLKVTVELSGKITFMNTSKRIPYIQIHAISLILLSTYYTIMLLNQELKMCANIMMAKQESQILSGKTLLHV